MAAQNPINTIADYLQTRKWLFFEKGLQFVWDELYLMATSTPLASTLSAQTINNAGQGAPEMENAIVIGNETARYTPAGIFVEPPSKFRN